MKNSMIRILGQDIFLITTPQRIAWQDKAVNGLYVPEKKEAYYPGEGIIILYKNNKAPDVWKSNLIHEILEVIDVQADLKLNHTQISTIAVALYQVLKDNKHLLDIYDEEYRPGTVYDYVRCPKCNSNHTVMDFAVKENAWFVSCLSCGEFNWMRNDTEISQAA